VSHELIINFYLFLNFLMHCDALKEHFICTSNFFETN
jgi:hypothetical protein